MTASRGNAEQPIPMAAGPVRIVLPTEVAFDLGKLQKAFGNLAERLGCRACFSGRDCTFRLERDFVIDPQTLAAKAMGGIIIDS